MPHFMVGNDFPLAFVDEPVFLFQACNKPFHRLFKFRHVDFFLVPSHRQKGRFVDEIGQVRSHHARCHFRQFLHIDVLCGFNISKMNLEDFQSPHLVGPVHQDMPVETPRSQQRRIKNFRPVCGGQQNDTYLRIESVHFNEQLIKCLFPFIMPRHAAHTAGFSQGIKFIDENDARCLLFSLNKKIPHPGSPQADEHFYKFRSTQAEKGDTTLPRHRFGKQGFPRPGRPHEKNTLGDFSPQFGKSSRFLQKIDNFNQFLLCFINAGNIIEGHVQFIFHINACLVFPEGHEARLLSAHPFHHEIPDADEDKDGEDPRKEIPQKGRFDLTFKDNVILLKHF